MYTINFEDGSFIRVEKSPYKEGYTTIIMCGANTQGNKITMSSSDLSPEQAEKLINAIQNP